MLEPFLGVDVEGHDFFCCRTRELFVSKSVWWFLFEGDELGDFCQGFYVECSCSAYDSGLSDENICFSSPPPFLGKIELDRFESR